MPTTTTHNGQVTIPKQIRDALGLTPGSAVVFAADKDGNVILRKAGHLARTPSRKGRFASARGKADIKWRTDELMALLRGKD
jgi:antitoxin PrlF